MRISYQKKFTGSNNVIIWINKLLLLLMIFFQSINAALEKALGLNTICTTWNMESNVDQGMLFGTLLTDLSKPFEWPPHDLFLAKCQAYWFDNKSDKNLLHDKKFYLVFDRVLLLRPIFFFFNIHLWMSQMIILYMAAKNTNSLVKSIQSIVYRTFK